MAVPREKGPPKAQTAYRDRPENMLKHGRITGKYKLFLKEPNNCLPGDHL